MKLGSHAHPHGSSLPANGLNSQIAPTLTGLDTIFKQLLVFHFGGRAVPREWISTPPVCECLKELYLFLSSPLLRSDSEMTDSVNPALPLPDTNLGPYIGAVLLGTCLAMALWGALTPIFLPLDTFQLILPMHA